MINIILCGKPVDTTVSCTLLPTLERYGGVQYFNGKSLEQYGSGTIKYLVYDCENLPQINFEKGIILFKNSFISSEKMNIPNGFLCILEMKNSHAAEILNGTGAAAITCGTSSKDTLSIAGLDEASATLSLQRSVRTVEGKILEPHDFTVKLLSQLSPTRILAVCAALLLSGEDSSLEYVI
ncbi:hypothetical protein [Caproiciproducens galactitolivorans]|uniref:Uncharacterized protein n=1 Tax=Caproiciproducens galactitolivorans TaxID=642589 RepID=A0ABT4BQC5_9FIRM|nr:hypothetical protein [Caproiciproducens galactitolivorans]MCY1713094.1 hypothetical protein [Caproiciproducens galactitolivorans]